MAPHWLLQVTRVISSSFGDTSRQYHECWLHGGIMDEIHDDVIKWKHFPRLWPFVREIHRSPVNSPHKGQWRGALMFSLICAWINGWVKNREAGDLRRHRAHYDVNVMWWSHGMDTLYVTGPLCGKPIAHRHKRSIMQSVDVLFVGGLDKLLKK